MAPLLTSLANFDHDGLNDVSKSTDKITKLIVNCSLSLVPPGINHKCHGKQALYAKLPDDVKDAPSCLKTDGFSDMSAAHDN